MPEKPKQPDNKKNVPSEKGGMSMRNAEFSATNPCGYTVLIYDGLKQIKEIDPGEPESESTESESESSSSTDPD